jgi:hypothetical protein
MLVGTGLRLDTDGELAEPERVVAALIKSGVGANGHVLGQPTVIFRGRHSAREARPCGAVRRLRLHAEDDVLFNTYDPIQQAPEGGSQACCIVRL